MRRNLLILGALVVLAIPARADVGTLCASVWNWGVAKVANVTAYFIVREAHH